MDLLQTLILALIQGLTELIPISSSGHLLLAGHIMHWQDQGLFFDVALHLGTVLAIMLYFRKTVGALMSSAFNALRGRTDDHTQMMIFLIIGTIPAVIGGVLVSAVLANLRSPTLTLINMVVFGAILYVADKKGPKGRLEKDMKLTDAILIGCAQAIALLPGVSRSGACMTMARTLGFKRSEAFTFTMMLSIPAILAATVYTTFQAYMADTMIIDTPVLVGVSVSFMTSYMAIHLVFAWISRYSLALFAFYRIIVGGLVAWVML